MATTFKQIIPGNPGTSFVVCLLFTLKKKYGIEVGNKDQIALFERGIVQSQTNFHSGVLSVIAKKHKKTIFALSNNSHLVNTARREVDTEKVTYQNRNLDANTVYGLLDNFGFVTLSTDIYEFYPYYHDYHFCCVYGERDALKVFEPKRGKIMPFDGKGIQGVLRSVEENLGDARLAFAV